MLLFYLLQRNLTPLTFCETHRGFVSKLGTSPQTHGIPWNPGWFWIGKPPQNSLPAFSGILIVRHPYFSNISTQPLCFNLLKLRCPKSCQPQVRGQKGRSHDSCLRNPRPETWDGNKNKQLFNLWSHSGINWSIWFSRILSLFCSSDWPASGWSGNLPEMGGCFSEPSSDNAGLIADAEIPFLCRFSWIFEDQIKAFSFWCFHLVEGRNVTQLGFCSFFLLLLTLCSQFHHHFCH